MALDHKKEEQFLRELLIKNKAIVGRITITVDTNLDMTLMVGTKSYRKPDELLQALNMTDEERDYIKYIEQGEKKENQLRAMNRLFASNLFIPLSTSKRINIDIRDFELKRITINTGEAFFGSYKNTMQLLQNEEMTPEEYDNLGSIISALRAFQAYKGKQLTPTTVGMQARIVDNINITRSKEKNTVKTPKSIPNEVQSNKVIFDLEASFSNIIGQEPVKDFVRSLQSQIKVQQARKSMGLSTPSNQTLHMIFKGNPGTGKTTIARIIAQVLYELKVLNTNTFIETDRSGLVAGWLGQTAIKTKDIIESALGGVLFIDEAYALASKNELDSFGQEAIDTLVKYMEDYRERLVVILAGYADEMEFFLNANPGLQSRFPSSLHLNFDDFSVAELLQITENMFAADQFILTVKAKDILRLKLKKASEIKNFGNGRYVRNLYEESLRKQAVRINRLNEFTRESLTTITEDDI